MGQQLTSMSRPVNQNKFKGTRFTRQQQQVSTSGSAFTHFLTVLHPTKQTESEWGWSTRYVDFTLSHVYICNAVKYTKFGKLVPSLQKLRRKIGLQMCLKIWTDRFYLFFTSLYTTFCKISNLKILQITGVT